MPKWLALFPPACHCPCRHETQSQPSITAWPQAGTLASLLFSNGLYLHADPCLVCCLLPPTAGSHPCSELFTQFRCMNPNPGLSKLWPTGWVCPLVLTLDLELTHATCTMYQTGPACDHVWHLHSASQTLIGWGPPACQIKGLWHPLQLAQGYFACGTCTGPVQDVSHTWYPPQLVQGRCLMLHWAQMISWSRCITVAD